MELKVGTTSKRINSTSQSIGNVTTLNVTLKDNCSRHDPTFLVSDISSSTRYNYAVWNGDYYYIDDIVYLEKGLFEIQCSLDPLATFKSAITGTHAYVAYAGNSSLWNKIIDDPRVSPEGELQGFGQVGIDMFNLTPSTSGAVVMTWTQTIPSAGCNAGVHTGVMSIGNFRKCMRDLTNIEWFDPDNIDPAQPGIPVEMFELIAKVIQSFSGSGSYSDNILRCVWLPFSPSALGGSYRYGLAVGGLLADSVEWYEIETQTIYTNNGTINLGWQAATDSYKFLRNPRFSSIQIYTPGGYGNIPISYVMDQDNIYYKAAICAADGNWTLRITEGAAGSGITLGTFSGCVGVDLTGSIVNTPDLTSYATIAGGQALATAVTVAVGGSIAGGGAAGMAKAASNIKGNFIQNPLTAATPAGSISGASSSLFVGPGSVGTLTVFGKTFGPVDLENYTSFCGRYGYPCNKYITLGDTSGFVQCVGASVSGATGATAGDKSVINGYLNDGIYIE